MSNLVVTAAVKQVTWSECECVCKVVTDSANKDVNNDRFWQGFFVKWFRVTFFTTKMKLPVLLLSFFVPPLGSFAYFHSGTEQGGS